jgi:hypothetical protein
LRTLLVVVPALFLAAFSVALTFANGAGRRAPDLALKMGTGNSAVAAAAASQLVVRPNPDAAAMAQAEALAVSALKREPVNVAAVRTLGLIVAVKGQQARAERLFNYSERLSRRDDVTQLWLIESAVRRNSIPQALRHYDRLLRTSVQSRDLLLPIMARAASTPAIADGLVDLLVQRPPWWPWFLNTFSSDPQSSSAALAGIVRRLGLRVSSEVERQVLERTLARLVRDRDYATALAIYRASMPRGADSDGLTRDGDFERAPLLAPFDWTLVDEPDLGAFRERTEGREGTVLLLVASSGRGGEVARQLLVLPSGRYRLTLVVGGVPAERAGRPSVGVNCAAGDRQPLQLRLPDASSRGRRVSADFTVPSGDCAAQWLTVSAAPSDNPGENPWIDKLSLRPI